MSYINVGQLVIIRPSSEMRKKWYLAFLERTGVVLQTNTDRDSALVSFSENEEVHILQEDLAVFISDLEQHIAQKKMS